MKPRLWRYDVFRFAQNDVARFTRNDAMFAINHQRSDIIRRSRHHWQRQHHLPKANIIEKTSFQRTSFFLAPPVGLEHVRLRCPSSCFVGRAPRNLPTAAQPSALPSSATGSGRCSVPCVRKRLAGSLVHAHTVYVKQVGGQSGLRKTIN